MEFASLGSGSKGNGTLIRDSETCLLVDCGFSLKRTLARLEVLALSPSDIDGILVTHEHTDHIRGVGLLARKFDIPVFLTEGTCQADFLDERHNVFIIDDNETFEIRDLEVQSVPVSHDARNPCQFIISNETRCFGLLTDVGVISNHLIEAYKACDSLVMEFNYDSVSLEYGDYPEFLKRRVSGNLGHLSNQQACEFLVAVDANRSKNIIAAHISLKNNDPSLVRDLLIGELGYAADQIELFDQEQGLDWCNV
ncbi:MAG: MBL fold metallo-hydrolase [Moraxellaceae bacterium]|nr:MAG: MBL fold metallo-hydrolase [Moraxellaceae bacterium]